MKPVAVVIESMGGGGAQQVAAALLRHWVSAGREVHLITLKDATADTFPVSAEVRRHVVGGVGRAPGFLGGIRGNLRRLAALRRAMCDSGAATVVSFVTATNVLAVLACLGLGVRVVVCERNDPRRQDVPVAWAVLRRLTYPCADLVTANSEMAARALRDLGISDDTVFLPNPLRRPSSSKAADKLSPLLLAVGRLHWQKGYDRLLAAFAEARPGMPGWRLRILGEGPQRAELEALAVHLGIADAVEFVGYAADPFPHYRVADVFVMTSRYEGSPNALWEAVSCGVPAVVTANLEGALEVLRDGTSCRTTDETVGAIAAALTELAADATLRRHLGEAGRVTVSAFDPECACAAWDAAVFAEGGER